MFLTIGGQNPSLEILKLEIRPEAVPHLKNSRQSTNFEEELRKCVPRLRNVRWEVIHNIILCSTSVDVDLVILDLKP